MSSAGVGTSSTGNGVSRGIGSWLNAVSAERTLTPELQATVAPPAAPTAPRNARRVVWCAIRSCDYSFLLSVFWSGS